MLQGYKDTDVSFSVDLEYLFLVLLYFHIRPVLAL